jgi:hypothetical protein
MKTLMPLAVGAASLAAVGSASAEEGGMMNGRYGGMWGEGWMGGYGGFWGPALLVVAVALVAWMIMKRRK